MKRDRPLRQAIVTCNAFCHSIHGPVTNSSFHFSSFIFQLCFKGPTWLVQQLKRRWRKRQFYRSHVLIECFMKYNILYMSTLCDTSHSLNALRKKILTNINRQLMLMYVLPIAYFDPFPVQQKREATFLSVRVSCVLF